MSTGNQEAAENRNHQRSQGRACPSRTPSRGKVSYPGHYSAFIATAFVYLAYRSVIRKYDLVHVHTCLMFWFSGTYSKSIRCEDHFGLHDPMPELMQTIFGLSEESFVRTLKRP